MKTPVTSANARVQRAASSIRPSRPRTEFAPEPAFVRIADDSADALTADSKVRRRPPYPAGDTGDCVHENSPFLDRASETTFSLERRRLDHPASDLGRAAAASSRDTTRAAATAIQSRTLFGGERDLGRAQVPPSCCSLRAPRSRARRSRRAARPAHLRGVAPALRDGAQLVDNGST